MSGNAIPYAGLILPDTTGLDPAPFLNVAQQVLQRLDPVDGDLPRVMQKQAAVMGGRFCLHVVPEEGSDFGPRVLLEVTMHDGTAPTDETTAKILSDTVLESLDFSEADIIEWYAPDTLLDRDDFVRLRSYVSPRRAEASDVNGFCDELFAHHEDDAAAEEQALSMDLRNALTAADGGDGTGQSVTQRITSIPERVKAQEPEEFRLSLAGWLMTGVLALVSFPVAAAVFIIGIMRGMNLRLATQALSVTMLFVVLANTDSVSRMVYQILH